MIAELMTLQAFPPVFPEVYIYVSFSAVILSEI